MNKVSPIILALLMFCFFLSACGNHNKNKLKSASTQVDFQEVFTKVIKDNCLECHSSYSNYQVAFQLKDSMLSSVLTGRMPKSKSPLSSELKGILKAWIDGGAPERIGAVSAPIPLAPTYDSLLVNVFAPKCLSCHSGSPDAPAPITINFATYTDLIESNNLYATRFGAGFLDSLDPEGSELIYLVTESDEPMPPLTLPGNPDYVPPAKVTTEEVGVMIEWIRKGFPKN